MDKSDAYKKYLAHCRNCSHPQERHAHKLDKVGNPVEMRLTFEEWCRIWEESGHWEERGRGGYVMARHNDLGHYEVGNVSIKLSADNIREANVGRKPTAAQRRKQSAAMKLKPHKPDSDEVKRKKSEAHRGVPLSKSHRASISAGMIGLKWWTNGSEIIKATTWPGPGYIRGRKLR